VVDANDIDAIYAHFGQPCSSQWKVAPDDDPVGQEDVTYEVQNILNCTYGDANLDRHVDFLDFQSLLNHWQNLGAGWAGCDFNGDGATDFLDFQTILNNWSPGGDWNPSQDTYNLSPSAGIGMGITPSNLSGPDAGGNVLLSSTVVGTTGETFTYSWSVLKDGVAYDPAGLVTDQPNLVLLALGGSYTATLTVTDSIGGSLSDSDTFTFSTSLGLDATFGTSGVASYDLDSTGTDSATAVAMYQGQIIVAANSANGIIVSRFNSDGSLDTTFGDSDGNGAYTGWTMIANTEDTTYQANSVAVDPDGRIFVGGNIDDSSGSTRMDFLVACFTSEGQLDTGFGSGGLETTDFNGRNDSINSLLVTQVPGTINSDPYDQIIAAGYASTRYATHMALAEYNYDYTTSTTTLPFTPQTLLSTLNISSVAYAVGVQNNGSNEGKIVLAGTYDDGEVMLARFTSAGLLDTDGSNGNNIFGNWAGHPGVAQFGQVGSGISWKTFSLSIQPDDKIVVGGDYFAYPDQYFMAMRVKENGDSLDSTFGSFVDDTQTTRTGYLTVDMGGAGTSAAQALALEPDGSIVMAGWEYNNPGCGIAVVQLSSTGDILGESGATTADCDDIGYAMAVQQSDGSFIVVGEQDDNSTGNSDILLARFAFQITDS
jgi:uncharacterized delta-60 repeat protein